MLTSKLLKFYGFLFIYQAFFLLREYHSLLLKVRFSPAWSDVIVASLRYYCVSANYPEPAGEPLKSSEATCQPFLAC